MLEPAASFVSAAGGGRPSSAGPPDLVLSVGGRDGGGRLASIPGFDAPPSLGLSCSGPPGGAAAMAVVERASDGAAVAAWWSDSAKFSSSIPLESISSQPGSHVLPPQVVKLYNVASSTSVSISLPSSVLFDLEANVFVRMDPLSSARGVRTVTFASADAKFALRSEMFKGCSQLKTVGVRTIVDGQPSVEDARWLSGVPQEAFRGCVSLESCPLGYVLDNTDDQTLGSMCFYGCKKMPGNDGADTLRLSFAAVADAGCLAGCERISRVTDSGAVLSSSSSSSYFRRYGVLGLEKKCPEDPMTAEWSSSGARETQLYVEDGVHAAHVWKSVDGTWGWT